MQQIQKNKMAIMPPKLLLVKMGAPMIISMVLQALYNVVDSIFVTNMPATGALANEALTIAFPVQIMMIAVGVGTGVGLNAVLSKGLGEGDRERVNRAAGNGIFLSAVLYAAFLLFGIFLSEWFIGLFTQNPTVIEMGTAYLRICTCASFGSIGFTIYERLLQATGKTALSTVAQISGAVANIVLDYVFIFPLDMGVEGAAWATVIGQMLSLIVAMIFHYTLNREVSGSIRYVRPRAAIIRSIYSIGLSAALMQALLSVMMAGVNAILGSSAADSTVLLGSFGIYYKIQQIALFSAFGLSNTIITLLSFNYGMGSKKRSVECVKYGTLYTVAVTFIITVVFELLARPLSSMFALSQGSSAALVDVCERATRIAATGYVFMGFTVATQGTLQALGYAIKPLVLSLLRLVVFVFPICYVLSRGNSVLTVVWFTFPISEILTSVFSAAFLHKTLKNRLYTMPDT